jgi:hypothetical protein
MVEHWYEAVEAMEPHVFRIETPGAYGTGFFVGRAASGKDFGIATAAHVIDHADRWNQPIRLFHQASGRHVMLNEFQRVVLRNPGRDVAALLVDLGEFDLPMDPMPLAPEGKSLKVGVELGWIGYPGVAPWESCFFSGRVSSYRMKEEEYLIDGVAIHGVSGGPAFHFGSESPIIVGLVTQYVANRASGDALPGVAVVQSVGSVRMQIAAIKSFGAAMEENALKKQSGDGEEQPPPHQGAADAATPAEATKAKKQTGASAGRAAQE